MKPILENLLKNAMAMALVTLPVWMTTDAGAAVRKDKTPVLPQTPWNDPACNSVNRMADRTDFFAYETQTLAAKGEKSASSRYMSIEGDWRFNWVENANECTADFYSTGLDDSKWATMRVPGMWELNGFGDAVYVNIGYAWRSDWRSEPPRIQDKGNHVGSYRCWFTVPKAWNGERIYIHLGSVTSCVELYVNGIFAGYSEDSKVAAEFDITPYVKPGKSNLIAMRVRRWCDGSYLEDQDFWRFCGIARECYMYSRPVAHVEDIRITPDLLNNYTDGVLNVSVTSYSARGKNVELTLRDAKGAEVKKAVAVINKQGQADVRFDVKTPQQWSAESPYLYTLTAVLKSGSKELETICQNVGFRKVEIKDGQLLVNGKAVLIKGVDRHELDPDSGYVVSMKRMMDDIRVLKSLNVNAVRTCHYPDDPRWYDLCDRYGIYLTAETNIESHGMGYKENTLARNPLFHDAHVERQRHNVCVLKNHPSIIVWSLGNEAGYGKNFEDAYDWVKSYDSSRPCQYEQAGHNGKTDIFCPMYYGYGGCEAYAKGNNPRPLIQCEYAHAMGNSMGGFREYWDMIRKYPKYQGGYIWDFQDQGLRDKSKVTGKPIWTYGGDYGINRASDNNFNCNGVVAPDRSYNPHAYEVQYYYQNIWTKLTQDASGKPTGISIFNENFFVSLDDVEAQVTIEAEGKQLARKTFRLSDLHIAPQTSGEVSLPMIASALESKDAVGKEVVMNVDYGCARQQFVLRDYNFKKNMAEATAAQAMKVTFDEKTGFISGIECAGVQMMEAGYQLRPDFWRAPTDNDFGARQQKQLRAWRNPELKLVTFDRKQAKDGETVTAQYELGSVDAKLYIIYNIGTNGELRITQTLDVNENAEQKPGLMRYGMKMVMPKAFDQIEYYGRGPVENYVDRKDSQFFGLYKQTVDEQFYPYVRPQDNGNKCDVRWWSVMNAAGLGLQFAAEEPLECQSLKYLTEDMDPSEEKSQWHSGDLAERPFTSVHIAQKMRGLACENSWGAQPLPQYRIPFADRTFTFVVRPCVAK